MPRLTLTLSRGSQSVEVTGLLDTGASINVMPYSIGRMLGAVWEDQSTAVPLSGSLGQHEARALLVSAYHPQIAQNQRVRLAFAWTASDDVPLLFGQMNFFLEFDVCFYRSQYVFDVRLKSARSL
jgi:hypothetical protein